MPDPKDILTTARVDELVEACMIDASTAPITSAIIGRGIMNDFVFVPDKIEEHHEEIHELLLALPDTFQQEGGGGWSFLNMCMTKDGVQWTGLHSEQEALMCLGQAAGWLGVIARFLWKALPGEMPYVTVLSERKPVEMASAEVVEEINQQMLEHMAMHEHEHETVPIEERMVTISTPPCIHCGKPGEVTLPKEAWERYNARNGQHIQVAWPEGSAAEREQLINGTHGECFEAMFPADEEEGL
ncbi:MAG TPA: hypothetical protein VIT65_23195 [Microlunatus sp.]